MGKCVKCGCGIRTSLGLPAICTGCAGFRSPFQKEHVDNAIVSVVKAGLMSLF